MNNLHRDLLEESAFREQLLATTLAANRRARRNRALAKASAAFCIIVLAGLITFPRHHAPKSVAHSTLPFAPSASSAVNQSAPPTYAVIHTEPFTSTIHTTPLPPKDILTAASRIKILDTAPEPAITSINDDQLLALFAGQSVALVAGPHGEELIFLETDPPISN